MVLAFQRKRLSAILAFANLEADSARHVNEHCCEQHSKGVVKRNYASRGLSQLHTQWKFQNLLRLIQELQSSLWTTQS